MCAALFADIINMFNAEYLIFGVFREIKDYQSPFPVSQYGPAVSSVESNSKVHLREFTSKKTGKHDDDNAVKREIDIEGGKSSAAKDVDSTIQRLLLEFGSQKPKDSDDITSNMNAQKRDEVEKSHTRCRTEPFPLDLFTFSRRRSIKRKKKRMS